MTYKPRTKLKEVNRDISLEEPGFAVFFPTEYDKSIAQEFLKRGRNFMFALAIDYPGLYGIPICYYDAVRREMKEMGFSHGYGKFGEKPRPRYKLFCLGPRVRSRYYCAGETRRSDAWGFKVFWLNTKGWRTE